MNTELPVNPNIDRLVDAHPLLSRSKTPACFSHLPSGWYDIVDRLCSDIEKELGPQGCTTLEIRQIKQKFGTPRFYCQLGDSRDLHIDVIKRGGGHQHFVSQPASEDKVERVRELVRAACAASETICEKCGRVGKTLVHNHWYLTRCEEHAP